MELAVRSERDLLPQWRCDALPANGDTVCGLEAKWRKRFIRHAATWTLYCDHHKPDGAERITPGMEWYEVTVIAEVRIGVLESGNPDAAIDRALRSVDAGLRLVGAQGQMIRTSATLHPGTASAAPRLQLATAGGGGGTPFSADRSNGQARALVRQVKMRRGSR